VGNGGEKGKRVARAESMGWIASPEAFAASLVSRYVTCKFVLRRNPPFFIPHARFLSPNFPLLVLSPRRCTRSWRADTRWMRYVTLVVDETKLKQRLLYSFCVCGCILVSDLLKVRIGLCVHAGSPDGKSCCKND